MRLPAAKFTELAEIVVFFFPRKALIERSKQAKTNTVLPFSSRAQVPKGKSRTI